MLLKQLIEDMDYEVLAGRVDTVHFSNRFPN